MHRMESGAPRVLCALHARLLSAPRSSHAKHSRFLAACFRRLISQCASLSIADCRACEDGLATCPYDASSFLRCKHVALRGWPLLLVGVRLCRADCSYLTVSLFSVCAYPCRRD